MNAFDSVELHPIADPIVPETGFPYQTLIMGLVAGIAAIIVVVFIVLYSKRSTPHQQWDSQMDEMRAIRKQLKLYERETKTTGNTSIDLDLWWRLLEMHILKQLGVQIPPPSLEEFQELVVKDASINISFREQLLQITGQLERVRYSGKADPVEKEQVVNSISEIFKAIVQEELFIH